jgi:hypothetical protein
MFADHPVDSAGAGVTAWLLPTIAGQGLFEKMNL